MARAAKLGGTIALDGEKEYKKAIDEITAGLKVNYTQMGLVAAQYAVAGNSEEALRAKSVALSDTIASQTEKIELMRGQLAKSIEKNGEGSKTTMQYQAALNKAETELVKMNNQMDGYQQQLAQVNEGTQNASKSTKSLADVAMGMADTFGLSVPPAMQNTISKLDGVSASGAAAVGMIGAMVGGLAKLTINTSQTADNLLTLSSTTGLSTDALQVYADGISLQFDGSTAPSAKHYKCNAAIKFEAGQRVRIIKDSGTYVVEYPVGAPLTKLHADTAGTATSANTANSAATAAGIKNTETTYADIELRMNYTNQLEYRLKGASVWNILQNYTK